MFCDRVVVLENGHLIFDGEPGKAISYYLEREEKNNSKATETKADVKKSFFGDFFHNTQKISRVQHGWNKEVYNHAEEMVFQFSFELDFDPHRLIIGIPIWDDKGFCITSFNSDHAEFEFEVNNGIVRGSLKTQCHLNPGTYESVIAIVDGSEFLYRQKNTGFKVAIKERLFGFATFPQEWTNHD